MPSDAFDFDDAPDDLEDWDDDLDFWRDALPELSTGEFSAILDDATQTGAMVAALMMLDLFSDAWDEVDKAEKNDTPHDEFVDSLQERLDDVWGERVTDAEDSEEGEPGSGIDLALDTSTQQAYGAGREEEQSETAEFLEYCAEPDACDVCAECDGTILPADDPWWDTHRPEMHFRCRCHIESRTEEYARRMGIDAEGPDVDADPGFGFPGAQWVPDLTGRPPELVHLFRLRHSEWLGPQ